MAPSSGGAETEETNPETTAGVGDDADAYAALAGLSSEMQHPESWSNSQCSSATTNNNSELQQLKHQVSLLQQQVASLTKSMRDNTESAIRAEAGPLAPPLQQASPVYSTTTRRQRSSEPREPHFVGPTRSAFSFRIAETSLFRMGVAADLAPPLCDSASGSPRQPSLEFDPSLAPICSHPDPLLSYSLHEILRLLDVFQEEVDSVYPFLQIDELAANTHRFLKSVRHPEADTSLPRIRQAREKDVQNIKVAIATAIVIEAHGRNDQSTALVDSVESRSSMISRVNVDLKEVQRATMLVSSR